MEAVRITAKTLEEAITKACIELGATSEMISYDILETGSNGVFGIGARPYVIEARKKEEQPAIALEKQAVDEKDAVLQTREQDKDAAAVHAKQPEVANASFENGKDDFSEKKLNASETENRQELSEESKNDSAASPVVRPEEREPRILKLSEEEKQEAIQAAQAFLQIIFDSMDMQVQIEAEFDAYGELLLNLSGEEMGVLIGKRGQTLDALQYLLSQVINKHRSLYIRVRVDTENYRARRKEALESLARNISYKVRRTRRSVALEPMNPYERRIIHSILQNERDVATRSEGEEPFRHVVIYSTRRRH